MATKGATRAFECATSSRGSPESVRKASGVQAPVAVQRPAVASAARENETGCGGRAGDGKRGREEALEVNIMPVSFEDLLQPGGFLRLSFSLLASSTSSFTYCLLI